MSARSTPAAVSKIIDVLGEPKIAGASEWSWCCPFCVERGQARDDTRYRLTVNPFKKESHGVQSKSGFFFCFNCEAKGTVELLLKRLGIVVEAATTTWTEILTELAVVGKQAEHAAKASEQFTAYPCDTFAPVPGMEAYEYLVHKRGLSLADIAKYSARCGTKRYRGRIFFPSFNEDGLMDFWVARSYSEDTWGPKYLAAPDMPRKLRIYRYYEVMRDLVLGRTQSVVVTEGAISAIRAGSNGLATYGKYVSPEQVEMLVAMQRRCKKRIQYLVALDGDALSWSLRLARVLFSRGLDSRVVRLPREHDPASLPPAEWVQVRDSAVPYRGYLTEAVVGLSHVVAPSF